jgi:hypothetical protein
VKSPCCPETFFLNPFPIFTVLPIELDAFVVEKIEFSAKTSVFSFNFIISSYESIEMLGRCAVSNRSYEDSSDAKLAIELLSKPNIGRFTNVLVSFSFNIISLTDGASVSFFQSS